MMSDVGKKVSESVQNQVTKLLKHLFREFASYHDLDVEQMRTVKMQDFVLWANCSLHDWYAEPAQTKVRDVLEIGPEVVEAVRNVFSEPWTAIGLLQPLWHMLCLLGQKPIKHVPDVSDISLKFAWDVGTPQEKAVEIRVPFRFDPNMALSDGFLCCLLKDQYTGILQSLAGNGLDKLYAAHALPTAMIQPKQVSCEVAQQINDLAEQRDAAVAKQDFELACQLRDRMDQLKKG